MPSRMLSKLLLVGACLLAWPIAAAAQAPLLPAQLGAWERKDWQQVGATELERVAGEQAALLREYGCQRAEQAVYRHGAAEWRVRVSEMQDRSSAYGAFTLLGPIVARRLASRNALLFYEGNYLVHSWATGAFDPPVGSLVEHLKQIGAPQPSLPTLPGYLPREGFVEGSDRYLLGPLALAEVAPLAPGDWAGFAYGAEAEAGRYRVGRSEATLLLFSYPTPQIARERLLDFERLFNLNGTGDPARPLAFAKRSGTLVVFVSGAASGQDAATLLDRVRYQMELSWSETSPAQAEPHWAVTMLQLFIGTGLFLVYAFMSALAFAGVRLLIQRLLPGKIFDRPEDKEIIRLNLSFKP